MTSKAWKLLYKYRKLRRL